MALKNSPSWAREEGRPANIQESLAHAWPNSWGWVEAQRGTFSPRWRDASRGWPLSPLKQLFQLSHSLMGVKATAAERYPCCVPTADSNLANPDPEDIISTVFHGHKSTLWPENWSLLSGRRREWAPWFMPFYLKALFITVLGLSLPMSAFLC